MPSIMKMINGPNRDLHYLHQMANYMTAPFKTGNGHWVGSYGCSADHAIEDMYMIKNLYHKPHGKQGEHYILSPTSPSFVDNDDYLRMGREVALYLSDFQCLFALHLDSQNRHLHFLVNSASYKDGHKFSQSPSDLNRFRTYISSVLEKYGFDILSTGASELYDHSDHSGDAGGMTYLEVETPFQPIRWELEEWIQYEFNRAFPGAPMPFVTESEWPYEREEAAMNQAKEQHMPITRANPGGIVIAPPPITIQPEVNIYVKGSYDAETIHEECSHQMQDAAQLSVEIYQKLAEAGMDKPVSLHPTVNLSLDSTAKAQTDDAEIIETTLADATSEM